MAVRAALIDLDGTLWDSAPWYAELLSRHTDHEDVVAVIEKLSTPGEGLNVAAELRRAGYTNPRFVQACRERGAQLALFEGAEETLRIAGERVALGVVTNLPGWMALPMLQVLGLGDVFSVIQGAAFGVRPKPSPSGILRAVSSIPDLEPANVFYVGDTAADAAASDAAGAKLLWASWGYDALPGRDALYRWSDIGDWL